MEELKMKEEKSRQQPESSRLPEELESNPGRTPGKAEGEEDAVENAPAMGGDVSAKRPSN
jgi:hypothetical protein